MDKTKQFLELPYCNYDLLKHNLDVTLIEKNVFDNVFNTVMDIKNKNGFKKKILLTKGVRVTTTTRWKIVKLKSKNV